MPPFSECLPRSLSPLLGQAAKPPGAQSAARPPGKTRSVSPPRQSVPAKIFHFTEIRKWRMCRSSWLTQEGRSCVVTFREPGLRWTRQRWAREVRAGRIALREPKLRAGRAALSGSSRPQVSGSVDGAGKTAAKWRTVRTAKPCGPGRRCYGQAFAEVEAGSTGRAFAGFRESEGGQKELGSRESTA